MWTVQARAQVRHYSGTCDTLPGVKDRGIQWEGGREVFRTQGTLTVHPLYKDALSICLFHHDTYFVLSHHGAHCVPSPHCTHCILPCSLLRFLLEPKDFLRRVWRVSTTQMAKSKLNMGIGRCFPAAGKLGKSATMLAFLHKLLYTWVLLGRELAGIRRCAKQNSS